MAISAVPSNAVAQESTARISSSAEIERRESAPVAKPSVIANISPEGRLRAEQEQQVAVPPATQNANQVAATQAQEVLPQQRTAAEEANAAADVAAVSAQAVNVVATRVVGNANAADFTSDAAVESVAATAREPRQPAPVVPVAIAERPEPAVANVQPATPREGREAAPTNARQGAPATVASEESPARPAEGAPKPSTVQTAERLPEQGLDAVRLSQTAKDFVAAFNASQNNRALALERAEPVRQTQASNAAELRPAPAGNAAEPVASVAEAAPRPEAGSARFDTSTFAVGVARVATTATQRSSQAEPVAVNAANDSNNDTASLLRSEVRGESNPAPALASNSVANNPVDASSRAAGAPQVAAIPEPGNQGPAPSTLSKQLNVLANLLTPGQ